MATIPNRLQPDTPLADNLALINDNFDKTVQDFGDMGAKFTNVYSLTVGPVAASSGAATTINFVDSSNQYAAGKVEFVPRVQVYVDVNDPTYVLPSGGSLTLAQANADVIVRVAKSLSSIVTAVIVITIRNYDTNPHTYYMTYDASYKSSPPAGNFR